jgi:hypothetical protein
MATAALEASGIADAYATVAERRKSAIGFIIIF